MRRTSPQRVLQAALLLPAVMVLLASHLAAQTLRPKLDARSAMASPTIDGTIGWAALAQPKGGLVSAFGVNKAADSQNVAAALEGFQGAARFARDSTGMLRKQLDVYANTPAIFLDAAKNQVASAIRVLYAATALDDAAMGQILNAIADTKIRAEFKAEADAIKNALRAADKTQTTVSLFADGTIRGSVNGDGDGGGSTGTAGTGSIGIAAQWGSGWQLSTSVAVASTIDTVRNGVGSLVLVPAAGRGRISTFIVEAFSPPIGWRGLNIGFHGYLSGANSLWEVIDSSTATPTPSGKNAAVIGIGLGLYRDFLCNCRLLNTEVQIGMTAGWAWRRIQGNAAQTDAFLKLANSGSADHGFNGPELGLSLTMGGVRAGVEYYRMSKATGDIDIPSLTGGQLVIGLSVAANIVSGPLTPR